MHRFTLVALVAFAAGPLFAAEIHVPGDHPTIQAAIDAAQTDDVILVAPGEYHEALEMVGKRLSIVATAGRAHTVLHGVGGPILRAEAFSGKGAGLTGFTLTGGTGRSLEDGLTYGGALFLDHVTFSIRRCRFHDNHVTGDGGAVFARSPGGRRLELRSSVLEDNSAGGNGGALASDGLTATAAFGPDPGITGNLFRRNTAAGDGGGAWIRRPAAALIGNTYESNVAGGSGGGQWVLVSKSLFELPFGETYDDNVAGADGGGGAFVVQATQTTATTNLYLLVPGVRATRNRAGGRGGALFYSLQTVFAGSSLKLARGVRLRGALLTWNHADAGGGAVAQVIEVLDADPPSSAQKQLVFESATLVGNTSTWGGSVLHFEQEFAQSHEGVSVILTEHAQPWSSGQDATFTYSDILGGAPGEGNVDVDPQFFDPANGDYRLRSTSPLRGGAVGYYGDDIGYTDYSAIGSHDPAPISPGSFGQPQLLGAGDVMPGGTITLTAFDVDPALTAFLVVGTDALYLPFKAGVLVPEPLSILAFPIADPGPLTSIAGVWPAGWAAERSLFAQVWVQDPGGAAGYAASNAVSFTQPTVP